MIPTSPLNAPKAEGMGALTTALPTATIEAATKNDGTSGYPHA